MTRASVCDSGTLSGEGGLSATDSDKRCRLHGLFASVDDDIINAEYSIDLSRRSSKNEYGNLPKEKSSTGQSGDLCPHLTKFTTPCPQINVDQKTHFGYLNGYRSLNR